jgi:FtsZ-binding cell division protein ZapB
VTGEEPEVDSHTLIAYGIAHQVSVYEAEIEELKEKYNFLKDEFGKGKVIQEFLDRSKKMNAKLDTIKRGLEDILKVIDET